MDSTARLTLSKIGDHATSPVTDLATAINDNANKLDTAVLRLSGSGEPTSAGLEGRFYRDTDTNDLYYDDGTGWVPLAIFSSGDLKVSAASTTPAGWHLCDGSALSRTTYAALYDAIGTAFGAGDGSTTFNVPDYRGRTIVGAGNGTGLTARALGAKGGEETHLLTSGESGVAAHSHSITDKQHTHAYNDPSAANTVTTAYATGSNAFTQTGYLAEQTSPSYTGITGTNNNVAADAASGHNNMQPFAVANVFIKL